MNIIAPMNKNHTLGVIVPIYNEEKYLKESVNRLLKVGIFSQIILVDDNSTDSSFEIANSFSQEHLQIIAIKTNNNEGKGNAVTTGSKKITTDYLIVHDADLEYFPSDIPDLYQESVNYPTSLILGSRVLGDKERTNIYYYTYLGNKIFAKIFSILNRVEISDIASCYWLIKVDQFMRLNIEEKGFAIEVEVLSKFLKTGNQIREVPIKYSARSYQQGKKIKFKDALAILQKIVKYRFL